MVNNIRSEIEGVGNSLRIMKEGLHGWDDVDDQIDEKLKEIETVLKQSAIDSNVLEEFRKDRERLWQLSAKERAANIENAEKALPWIKGTAAVGLAVPATFLAWKLGAGALLIQGARMLGSQVIRHPIQTVKQVSGFIGSQWKWVLAKWYRRWAPVPLGIGFGFARNYWVAREQEKKREALKTDIPNSVVKKVKQEPPSWDEGIQIAQNYPAHSKLMEHLLPALYNQVVTPEGALVLTHTLLETFSLNPSLDVAIKNSYGVILEREFERALQRFGKWILVLDLTEATSSEERVFEIGEGDQKIYVRGYYVKPGIKDLIREMRKEKEELLKMMGVHETWVGQNSRTEIMDVIRHRRDTVDQTYVIHWGEMQSKLNKMKQYLDKTKESFKLMGQDFQGKNLDIWTLYALKASPMNVFSNPSEGQFLGWFGGSLFVKGMGWTVMLKTIPYGIAGGFISASYTAEELAKLRQPIRMCLPGFGALCEQI